MSTHIKVLHLEQTLSEDLNNLLFREEEVLAFAKSCRESGDYALISEYVYSGEEEPLDAAFKATNSIDGSWFKNVPAAEHLKEVCRSTSVGDIIELNGIPYLVGISGFNQITGEAS